MTPPRPTDESAATHLLGERIRARRTELGLSLEGAAPRCDIHWSALGHIERGRRNMSVVTLLKVAKGLDVDPADLVRGLQPGEGGRTPATKATNR